MQLVDRDNKDKKEQARILLGIVTIKKRSIALSGAHNMFKIAKVTKSHFSLRLSTSTLIGYTKDHGLFLYKNHTHCVSINFLVYEPMKPSQKTQNDLSTFFCHFIVGSGMPFATSVQKYPKEMVACCDAKITVPCSMRVSKEVTNICKCNEVRITDSFKTNPDMVSITLDE